MALKGAEILIYPTAIGWESTDPADEKARQREAWMTVQRGHAVANGLPVVTVNRVGHEADPSGATGGIDFWGSAGGLSCATAASMPTAISPAASLTEQNGKHKNPRRPSE